MRAKSLKSSQILKAHMPYFRRPGHKFLFHFGMAMKFLQLANCLQFIQLFKYKLQNKNILFHYSITRYVIKQQGLICAHIVGPVTYDGWPHQEKAHPMPQPKQAINTCTCTCITNLSANTKNGLPVNCGGRWAHATTSEQKQQSS